MLFDFLTITVADPGFSPLVEGGAIPRRGGRRDKI